MKVVKIIGTVIAVILLVLVIAIFTLPSTAHMERSIVINAQPEEIYRELITFRNFNEWSPWAQKDTSAVYQFSGPELGTGAKFSWQSDDPDVGSGYMEILEVVEKKEVTTLMKFDGYDSNPTATFKLEPVAEGTRVTWTYDETDVSGLSKIFMLGIDGFLGGDYESGLEMLKKRIEAAPDFEYDLSVENFEGFSYVGVLDSSSNDPAMIAAKMAGDYGRLIAYLGKKEIEITGNPVAFFPSFSETDLTFICGIPIEEDVTIDEPGLQKRNSPEGLIIKAVYKGSYDGLQKAHEEVDAFAKYLNYRKAGIPWEEYLTDPEVDPDTANWITRIYYPVE